MAEIPNIRQSITILSLPGLNVGRMKQHMHFERFRHTALAKTYNTNRQTPDSAGTMMAMATGVKSYAGSIAVDQNAARGDCASMQGSERVSLLDLAVIGGLRSGIVTTTRITHATPAVLYARSVDRNWETDRGIPPSQRDVGCRDIARQLVEYPNGPIDVVFGGGRRAFPPGSEPLAERLMRDQDDRPMTVLGYANGPGYRGGKCPDFDEVDPADPDFLQESAVGLLSATHSGVDVPVYAQGPGAEVIYGVLEQNALFHVMLQALPPLRDAAGQLTGDGEHLPDHDRLTCLFQSEPGGDC